MTPAPVTRSRQRGLALVEVLIATLIFGLGALALTRFNATLVRHAEAARQRNEATLLAQARLDQLRTLLQWRSLGTPLPAEAGEAGPDGVRGRDAPVDAQGAPFDRHWHIAEDHDAGWRRIDVQVGWSDRDGLVEPGDITISLLLAPSDPAQTLRATQRRADVAPRAEDDPQITRR